MTASSRRPIQNCPTLIRIVMVESFQFFVVDKCVEAISFPHFTRKKIFFFISIVNKMPIINGCLRLCKLSNRSILIFDIRNELILFLSFRLDVLK